MFYYYRYLFVNMKVFNYSELHFAEVTFYKIHTLKSAGIKNFSKISVVATDGGGYFFGSGPTKSTPTKRTKTIFVESNSPDKCDTDFDAVAVIRSEMWAFKSRHFWRIHRDRGKMFSLVGDEG